MATDTAETTTKIKLDPRQLSGSPGYEVVEDLAMPPG